MPTDTRIFDLGEYGTAAATVTTIGPDVLYAVTAPHLRGTFTVRPLKPLESEPGAGATVHFGRDAAPAADHPRWTALVDKPVVHRVTLAGKADIRRHQLRALAETLYLSRERRNAPGTEIATQAVNYRAAATIAAIVGDYLTRSDLDALHHQHTIRAAVARTYSAQSKVQNVEGAISSALRNLSQARNDLNILQRLAAGEQLPLSTRQQVAGISAR